MYICLAHVDMYMLRLINYVHGNCVFGHSKDLHNHFSQISQ